VLRDEDPQALEDQRAAWRACLSPGDEVEQRLVDNAVVHTWMQDRARRAQAAKLNAKLVQFGVGQTVTDEVEVEELGRWLFNDRMGPVVFYPLHEPVELVAERQKEVEQVMADRRAQRKQNAKPDCQGNPRAASGERKAKTLSV
jgi:hypothetical protein